MNINQIRNRREKDTVLITLAVSKGANVNSVIAQLRKEASTANNIKDKKTMRLVHKAINRLVSSLSRGISSRGFIAYASYDGI